MAAGADVEFDQRLIKGLRVALVKARQLGYDVEQMDVRTSISDGVCTVHFAPLPVSGVVTAGGDLCVTVDPGTETVIDFNRGQ